MVSLIESQDVRRAQAFADECLMAACWCGVSPEELAARWQKAG